MPEALKIPLINFYDLAGVATPLMLGLLALAAMILDSWVGKKKPGVIGGFTLTGLILVLIFQALLHIQRANLAGDVGLGFSGTFFFDWFGIYFNYLFLASAILVVAMSISHLEGKDYHRGEYYILILIATAGMCILAGARDLIVAFLGLETMSLPVYALAAADSSNPKSNEAGLKYLLLGAFASAILLYGIALLYGITGYTDFLNLSSQLANLKAPALEQFSRHGTALKIKDLRFFFMLLGVGMVIIGFGFKIAAVPFHMWVPDVYEGAPTPITGYMAAGVKAAGFAVLLRIFLTAFAAPSVWAQSYPLLWALAAATMTVGNLLALVQTNLKRLLAYSSIAHAGYLLVGLTALVVSNPKSEAYGPSFAIMYYLLVYLFMNLGAFAVIVALGREKRGGEMIADYSDLARKRPFLAALMALFMLSLAGVPPLGGFFAKFYLFQNAVHNRLYWLVIIAVLNSVVAAYYYLRVVYVMYMQKEREEIFKPGIETGVLINTVLILCAVMVAMLGLAPSRFLDIIVLTFRAFL